MNKKGLGSEVIDYLEMKRSSTQASYRSGLRLFLEYYTKKHGEEATISKFLDRLDENAKLPRREKKRLVESEINGFIAFLSDGSNFKNNKKKSNKSIWVYFSSIQNFLKYKGYEVSARFLQIPPATVKKINHKHAWKIEEIKEFVSVANTMRDKAIILCLFQSGLGVTELCDLNYGYVKDELDQGKLPVYLHLTRQKTGEEFQTFLGRDAVKYLKLYLETRKDLKRDSPLFTMSGSDDRRLTTGAIQAKFREFVNGLSFIKEHELKGFNPVRPHSLRSGFRSRLTGKMDGDLIEFFMGHALGAQKRAYMNLPEDELREQYANFEHLLSIEKTSKDEMMEKKQGKTSIPKETLEDIESLKGTMQFLLKENAELKKAQEKLKKEIEEVDQQLEQQIEYKLSGTREYELKGEIHQLSSRIEELENSIATKEWKESLEELEGSRQ